MYIFKINTLDEQKKACTAILIEAENLNINGTLTVKTAYRTQERIIPGQEYNICLLAVKDKLTVGNTYAVKGSWISGTLHATKIEELNPAQ